MTTKLQQQRIEQARRDAEAEARRIYESMTREEREQAEVDLRKEDNQQ